MKRMIKIFVVSFMFTLLLSSKIYAVEITNAEKEIFELEHMGLQVLGIENDMRLCLGWMNDDKEEWKEPSEQAVKNLEKIQDKLKGMQFSKEIAPMRGEFIKLISKLQGLYVGVKNKSDETIKSELNDFWSNVESYNNDLKAKIDEFMRIPDFEEGFTPINESRKLFTSEEDRKEFDVLCALMEKKEYFDALIRFENLWGEYKGSPAEGIVVSNLIKCDEKRENNGGMRKEEFLESLSALMDKRIYYPNLWEVFYQWRTMDQFYNHGASNFSVIPNDEYIEKRWQVARVIMKQVESYPEDKWAKLQVIMLMDLPIIERGGPYGNSNLNHWGALFTDLLAEKEEANAEQIKETSD